MSDYMLAVKFLRNSAAHNNCLLNSLRKPYSKEFNPTKKIMTFVSRIDGISVEERKKRMYNPVVHDFVVTLFVYYKVVNSERARKVTIKELEELLENRFLENKNYFDKNEVIKAYYIFIKKIVLNIKKNIAINT